MELLMLIDMATTPKCFAGDGLGGGETQVRGRGDDVLPRRPASFSLARSRFLFSSPLSSLSLRPSSFFSLHTLQTSSIDTPLNCTSIPNPIHSTLFIMAASLVRPTARAALRAGASATPKSAGLAGLTFARGKATLPDLTCR